MQTGRRRRRVLAGWAALGAWVLAGFGGGPAAGGGAPPPHARSRAAAVRTRAPAVPPVPDPAALGLRPGADRLIAGRVPLLVAWSTGFQLPWFLEVYVPAGGRWTLAYQGNVTNQIQAVEAGPAGPQGQESVLCLGLSGGSDQAGAFYNLVEAGGQVHLAGELPGVDPAFGPGRQEWFADQHYTLRWQGGHLQATGLGLAATVPAGALTAAWHIAATGAVTGPAALQAQPGQAVALLPDPAARSRSPVLLGPFTSRAAAEAAIQDGFGAMAMYQQVQGFVIQPPPGTSYWVLASWPPGRSAPAAGAVVRIAVP
ncbi:conserved protein of unknown function [Candidatus Hydrogenisulfobacillus filiaventi]|uniref:Uncharacterized protein n=1 Tax=Candidatus Hydrogenisulfobacillus filiaventi TaxID=2707344 RepID=A0A6F8ZHK8_9FIRM|nr:conserved protein of unknown function [Candidatus Hydrogenisulfobacillus filiaventi]